MEEKNLHEKVTSLAKQRGFIIPDSEIYGGYSNTWDYGPYGVEVKNNIRKLWWRQFVQENSLIIGMESAIIMNPKVWEASGHVSDFSDILIDCKKCRIRYRADHLIEEALDIDVEGWSLEKIDALIREKKVGCPNCQNKDFTKSRRFNLLFKTNVGVLEDKSSTAYLRGETAQGMFVNYKSMLGITRKKLPFGLAQIGKAFRNEVTPGNYIHRTREFEQAEIEFFHNKNDWEKWFDYWLTEMKKFAKVCGIESSQLHYHDLPEEKRAHYSQKTVDIEYDFPFGRKELWGLAYRGDYDLKKHQDASGEDFRFLDGDEKYLPHVIEPSLGIERTLLAILYSSYHEENVRGENRLVLKLNTEIAPIKVAVLPLSKKPELEKLAKNIHEDLAKIFMTEYDDTQSIGKRYRRQDEIGTPYCLTVDFESLKDDSVTIRERDSMKQSRIKIKETVKWLGDRIK